MILWHAGIACALVYVTLGRRRIDYRFIIFGAIFPDVFDGLLAATGAIPTSRGPAHSLIFVTLEAIAIIVIFKGERRLAVFGLAVGMLTHLVADGMWNLPETFMWPMFGSGFDAVPPEPYQWSLVLEPWHHLSTWAGELVGAGLLAWFVVAFSLGDQERRRLFMKDGYLRP